MYNIILEKRVQKILKKYKRENMIYDFEKALRKISLDPYENNLDIKIII